MTNTLLYLIEDTAAMVEGHQAPLSYCPAEYPRSGVMGVLRDVVQVALSEGEISNPLVVAVVDLLLDELGAA